MRLRTKLSLAFTVLALLPAGILGWTTLATVEETFEGVFRVQLADAERTLRTEVERAGREATRTVSALAATAPTVEQVARDLYLGEADLAALVPLAEGLMVGRDLQVLFLLDPEGRVLSSGHLPARFGYRETELLALSRERPGTADLRWLEVRAGDRIERVLAIVSARPVLYGRGDRRLHVVGGRLLDDAFAARLRDLTGSGVTLATPEGEVLARAEAPRRGLGGGEPGDPATLAERRDPAAVAEPRDPAALGDPPSRRFGGPARARVRSISLSGAGEEELAVLRVTVSDAPLARARARILLVLLVSGALGVALSVLLGGLLASRITRPVDALAGAAGQVARGDYAVEVRAPASGELGHLVSAFNSMTGEIRTSRDRIASAERVAAWQEIARRLAHEIKNPLTPIAMSIETLRRTWTRRHPQFEEIFEESTQAILEEVDALRRIVAEFSRFARLPAPQPQPLAVKDLLEGTLGLFPEPPEGISLLQDVPDALPPVLADRDQIQQVLLNLVTNAVQAIQGGQGSGTVTVRAAGLGVDEVAIEVVDTGPGIDPAHRGELFTPYFTTKEGGTGLGLAICHRIVAEHGGRIEVESEPGAGATFRVRLPVAEADAD